MKSQNHIKISKGEESNFIWSVTLLEQVIAELNIPEATDRSTDVFNKLTHVFIDDPVSSLDENHLIELAVNLAALIKSESGLKFIITTLFYNVLFNEFSNKGCYMLERLEDGSYALTEKKRLKQELFVSSAPAADHRAIADSKVERYHFTLLRNLYERRPASWVPQVGRAFAG
jgi:hypothetical protein